MKTEGHECGMQLRLAVSGDKYGTRTQVMYAFRILTLTDRDHTKNQLLSQVSYSRLLCLFGIK